MVQNNSIVPFLWVAIMNYIETGSNICIHTKEQKLALSMINIMTLGRCQAVMLKTCSALYFNKYKHLKSIYVNIRTCVVFSFHSFFPGVQYELPCQIKVSISNNIL